MTAWTIYVSDTMDAWVIEFGCDQLAKLREELRDRSFERGFFGFPIWFLTKEAADAELNALQEIRRKNIQKSLDQLPTKAGIL